jgi:hypothetical protein
MFPIVNRSGASSPARPTDLLRPRGVAGKTVVLSVRELAEAQRATLVQTLMSSYGINPATVCGLTLAQLQALARKFDCPAR